MKCGNTEAQSITIESVDGTLRTFSTDNVAGGLPQPNDVRNGITFGVNNQYTGTCNVPPKESTAIGVPVDNTIGEAYITKQSLKQIITEATGPLFEAFNP